MIFMSDIALYFVAQDCAFHPEQYGDLQLISIDQEAKDCFRYVFTAPECQKLPVIHFGQHLVMR